MQDQHSNPDDIAHPPSIEQDVENVALPSAEEDTTSVHNERRVEETIAPVASSLTGGNEEREDASTDNAHGRTMWDARGSPLLFQPNIHQHHIDNGVQFPRLGASGTTPRMRSPRTSLDFVTEALRIVADFPNDESVIAMHWSDQEAMEELVEREFLRWYW